VGNRIATIEEDTSATWRLVSSQFNAVDLMYLMLSTFVAAATHHQQYKVSAFHFYA